MSLDQTWYLDVNSFARDTSGLHGVLKNYALWGGLLLLALLVVIAWVTGRNRDDAARRTALAFLAGASAVIALIANQLINPAFDRLRPCHALVAHFHPEVLLKCATDSSMPSDHAMIAGAFAVGLLFISVRLGLLAVLLALLVAFSRVYAGVHYPSDVAVGLGIGAAIALIIMLALRGPVTRLAARLADTPLRPLIAAAPAHRTA